MVPQGTAVAVVVISVVWPHLVLPDASPATVNERDSGTVAETKTPSTGATITFEESMVASVLSLVLTLMV